MVAVVVILLLIALVISFILNFQRHFYTLILFPVGYYSLNYTSNPAWLGYTLMAIALLYCVFGLWVVAYSEMNVFKKYEKSDLRFIDSFRETSPYQRFGILLSMLFSLMIMYGSLKDEIIQNIQNVFNMKEFMDFFIGIFAYPITFIIVTWLIYSLLNQVLGVIYPVRQEHKTDRLIAVIWIQKKPSKSFRKEIDNQLCMVFEQEERTLVANAIYEPQLRRLVGYTCEYTISTSLFGKEFVKNLPIKQSNQKVKTRKIYFDDLIESYRLR